MDFDRKNNDDAYKLQSVICLVLKVLIWKISSLKIDCQLNTISIWYCLPESELNDSFPTGPFTLS